MGKTRDLLKIIRDTKRTFHAKMGTIKDRNYMDLTVADFIFLVSKITVDSDCSHEIKMLTPWKKSYDKPRKHIKKQRHYLANKCLSSQSYGFSSSHVRT